MAWGVGQPARVAMDGTGGEEGPCWNPEAEAFQMSPLTVSFWSVLFAWGPQAGCFCSWCMASKAFSSCLARKGGVERKPLAA